MPTLQTSNKKRVTRNDKRFQVSHLTKLAIGGQASFKSQFLKDGFSYIEVLLSLFLILAIIVILLTASGTLWTSRRSSLQSIATKIASREIETLRDTPFSSLPTSGSISDPDLSKLPLGSANRTVTDYEGNTNIKQVTIEVTWREQDAARKITLETLIAENGL